MKHALRFALVLVSLLYRAGPANPPVLQAITNQSENETNKYADKNRLRDYRVFLCGCLSAKIKLFRLTETSVISSYITSLTIEYLYTLRFFGLS